METTRLTVKEAQYLQGILDSCYQDCNDEARIDRMVWSWSVEVAEGRWRAGVASSLCKKGLATCSDQGTEDACIAITRKGYDALQAYLLVTQMNG